MALSVCPHLNCHLDKGMGDARKILRELNYKESFFLKIWILLFEINLLIDSHHLMLNLCSFLNDLLIKLAIWRTGQRCQIIHSKPVLCSKVVNHKYQSANHTDVN